VTIGPTDALGDGDGALLDGGSGETVGVGVGVDEQAARNRAAATRSNRFTTAS
jgi:hypothetical protein